MFHILWKSIKGVLGHRKWIVAFLVYLFLLLFIDIHFPFYIFNFPPIIPLCKWIERLFEPKIHFFFFSFLLIWFLFTRKKEALQQAKSQFPIAVCLASFLSKSLKILCGRERPNLFILNKINTFHPLTFHNDYHSLPSGHAMVFLLYTFYFMTKDPKRKSLYMLLGLLGSMSRMVLLKHYPSDLFAGWILGYFSWKISLEIIRNERIKNKIST